MNIEVLPIIKFIFAIIFLVFALFAVFAKNLNINHKKAILVFWLIAPPIFFYFEYFFQAPFLTPDELTRFKDLQSHASKIWAGLAAVLALVHFESKKD